MLRPSSPLNFGMNNAQKEVCVVFFFIQDIKKTQNKKQKAKKKIKLNTQS